MKLVFFDIDGTLWDEKHFIPQSTIEAVRKLRANGHKAFICSGRARANINAPELFDIGFDGVVAACGNYIEVDGEVLFQRALTEEQIRTIIKVTQECGMPIVLEGPKKHLITENGFENDPYIDYLFNTLGEDAAFLDKYEAKDIYNKFSADVFDTTNYEKVKSVVCEFMDVLEHTKMVVEFVPKGTSKADGIEWLCKHYDVPVDDSYAIGDSINDVDMLKRAGHGICMGNGTAPAREVAEYITTDMYDDGIYNALLHYGLI